MTQGPNDGAPRAPAPPASPQGPATGSAASERRGAWTIGALLRWTQTKFDSVGLPDARLDAEHLLSFALQCSRMTLYVDHDRPVDDAQRARFRDLVRRRLAREPVAYIEGKRGFHALGLELAVDRRVLVPRPETEHLVDWLLEDLAGRDAGRVLDVGTGSGAIALAVAHHRRDLEVVATDVSVDALAVAQDNARRLGLAVTFVRSDLLADVPAGAWTAIAANLPYIRSDVIETLEPDVAAHEPRLALDGGPDGLVVIRRMIEQAVAPGRLADDGAIYLEVGFDQAADVADLLRAHGLVADTRTDHARIPRVVRGRPPALAEKLAP